MKLPVSALTVQKMAVAVLVIGSGLALKSSPQGKPPTISSDASASTPQNEEVVLSGGPYRKFLAPAGPAFPHAPLSADTELEIVPAADVPQFSRRDPSGESYSKHLASWPIKLPVLVGRYELIDLVKCNAPVQGVALCLEPKDRQDMNERQPFFIWLYIQADNNTAAVARQAFLNATTRTALSFDALYPLAVIGQRSGSEAVIFDAVCPRSITIGPLGLTQTVMPGEVPAERGSKSSSKNDFTFGNGEPINIVGKENDLAASLSAMKAEQVAQQAVAAAKEQKWEEAAALAQQADGMGRLNPPARQRIDMLKRAQKQEAIEDYNRQVDAYNAEFRRRKEENTRKGQEIQEMAKAGKIPLQDAVKQVQQLLDELNEWTKTAKPVKPEVVR